MKTRHILTLFILHLLGSLSAIGQEPLDSAYLAQIDSLIAAAEREQMARQVIDSYQQRLIRQEHSLSLDFLYPIARGLMLTGNDKGFRNHPGTMDEKSSIVNKADYLAAGAPMLAAWALKTAGVKSRSTLQRMLTANALSLAISCGTTFTLKHCITETRPDGSDDHSLPSGHTSFAFVSASVLAREYGHISPWIPVGGYTAATATQYLRLRHNKHWMNDLYLGAGIGLMATNLGYFLTDRIFYRNDEGILTPPEVRLRDFQRLLRFNQQPSGISFVSGTEAGSRTFDVDGVPIKAMTAFSGGVDVSWFTHENFAVELLTRCTTGYVKAYNEGIPSHASHRYSGDNMQMYHIGLAAKYSTPFTLSNRFNARAFAGLRHSSSIELTSADAPSLALPSSTNFELGGGIGLDAIDKKNYVLGFTIDYYHTFSDILRDRYSISTLWKILF